MTNNPRDQRDANQHHPVISKPLAPERRAWREELRFPPLFDAYTPFGVYFVRILISGFYRPAPV